MSFQDMKKNRKKDLQKLVEQIDTQKSGGGKDEYKDEREWFVTKDDAGNGSALIRFLPAAAGETLPWVEVLRHGFQKDGKKGKWFVENCLGTLGRGTPCPMCEYNQPMWDSGIKSDEEIARNRKRKTNYYSNIYVIEDKKNPENEGKVFLFRYGQKIKEKIDRLMHPPEEYDEEGINIFDFWDGCNFKMRVKKASGFANYDDAEFKSAEPLFAEDEKMEAIFKQEYPLLPYVAPKEFLPYAEMLAKVTKFFASDDSFQPTAETDEAAAHEEDDIPMGGVGSTEKEEQKETVDPDYDATLAQFAALAKE